MGQLLASVLAFFRSEISQLVQVWTAYQPERHYMRGPGPKWHEKHLGQGEPAMRVDGAGRIIPSR